MQSNLYNRHTRSSKKGTNNYCSQWTLIIPSVQEISLKKEEMPDSNKRIPMQCSQAPQTRTRDHRLHSQRQILSYSAENTRQVICGNSRGGLVGKMHGTPTWVEVELRLSWAVTTKCKKMSPRIHNQSWTIIKEISNIFINALRLKCGMR